MAQIKTLQQYIDYLFHRCGFPVMNVEVDRDTQMQDIASDTIQYFQDYNYVEGSYLEYFIFSAVANQRVYNMSGQNINGAFDMELSIGIDGINTLFAPTHELLYSDFVRKGSILGTDSPDYSPGLTLTSYDVAMLYLKEIKNQFGRGYTVTYNKNKELLIINPTPQENMIGVIYLYKKEDAINLYNNLLVKDLGYAKTLIQWGQNIGKYNVTMPDGITLNGTEIRTRGEEMEKDVKQRIIDESPPPDFAMG
jgi:hypothetical protein